MVKKQSRKKERKKWAKLNKKMGSKSLSVLFGAFQDTLHYCRFPYNHDILHAGSSQYKAWWTRGGDSIANPQGPANFWTELAPAWVSNTTCGNYRPRHDTQQLELGNRSLPVALVPPSCEHLCLRSWSINTLPIMHFCDLYCFQRYCFLNLASHRLAFGVC